MLTILLSLILASPLAIALILGIAPTLDFRNRPLSGSAGTCAFHQLPNRSASEMRREIRIQADAAMVEMYGRRVQREDVTGDEPESSALTPRG